MRPSYYAEANWMFSIKSCHMLNFVFNFSLYFAESKRIFASLSLIFLLKFDHVLNEIFTGRIFHVGFCPRPKLEQVRINVGGRRAPPADPIAWLKLREFREVVYIRFLQSGDVFDVSVAWEGKKFDGSLFSQGRYAHLSLQSDTNRMKL
jgi:hypothetical protein